MTTRPIEIDGPLPVLPTPFHEDGSIAYDEYQPLVELCLHARVGAVSLPAFGSEFYKLNDQERMDVVHKVVKVVDGRLPVVAQCNHGSTQVARDMALRMANAGASAIAVALPRQFLCPEESLLEFSASVASASPLPFILQDWNPGGKSISAQFVQRLKERCSNFAYVKYEEPNIGYKTRAIEEDTSGQVGVLQGWGGLYMLEHIPAGIRGIMPGTAIVDLLASIWRQARKGQMEKALETFSKILPYLEFSLRNIEQFHHVDKRLLVRRGILPSATVRPLTTRLTIDGEKYLELLIDDIMNTLKSTSRDV